MFPPGNASPGDAIAAHLGCRTAWFADLVGPLLVDHRRWDEFTYSHAAAGSPALGVVVIGTDEPPPCLPAGLWVSGFELSVSTPPLPDPGPAYQVACEITAAPDRAKLLMAVAERRAAGQRVVAKYRTGGVTAAAFPSDDEVAEVVTEASQHGAPLKFTAGLHSAVRFTDPAMGLEQHGFLNLMVAVALANRDGDPKAVLAALAEREAQPLVQSVRSWSSDEARSVRAAFVSFGCCGVEEPVADLVALGLLEKES
jgi:hypothetical protein